MELILAFAILNKAGGAYGVLSILTGHHLNFWQWLYNLLSFLVLPFYISALGNLLNRSCNVRKVSLACVIYVADSLIGLLYTAYFVHFWFTREDSSPTSYGGQRKEIVDTAAPDASLQARAVATAAADPANLSQSASPLRELFLTVSGIVLTTAFRLYYTLVFLSFSRKLLKQSALNQKYYGADHLGEEVWHPTSLAGRVKKAVRDLEMRAKSFLAEWFA